LAIVSGSGQSRPRASTVVTIAIVHDDDYELAAILASPDPGTLYSGLSLLVSAAVDGGRCAALVSFGALELLGTGGEGLPPDFARSFAELRDTLLGLENVAVWACAASAQSIETGLPVMSTPRFLRETAGARRLIHV
jgi:hypothetical protein